MCDTGPLPRMQAAVTAASNESERLKAAMEAAKEPLRAAEAALAEIKARLDDMEKPPEEGVPEIVSRKLVSLNTNIFKM